jgi:hypothetical protein
VSAAAVWTWLAGWLVVPGALLWLGGRMHRRRSGIQAAFRGAAVGYLLALVVVTVLLVAGPHHWPPDSSVRLWSVVMALPALALAGAVLGLLMPRQ